MITTAISATISAYSTAVAPRSSEARSLSRPTKSADRCRAEASVHPLPPNIPSSGALPPHRRNPIPPTITIEAPHRPRESRIPLELSTYFDVRIPPLLLREPDGTPSDARMETPKGADFRDRPQRVLPLAIGPKDTRTGLNGRIGEVASGPGFGSAHRSIDSGRTDRHESRARCQPEGGEPVSDAELAVDPSRGGS